MSPLQRRILTLLATQDKGLLLHDIANQLSQQEGERVYGASIPGAFSKRRSWVTSDNKKLNDFSLISISEEGRQALLDYEAEKEASHPMGAKQPGRFFVFIEERQVIKYHTMIIRNVADEAEAEKIAREQCEQGMTPQAMTVSIERSFAVRPVREGHDR